MEKEIKLEGLEDYELMVSLIPDEELPEGYNVEDNLIQPVLLGYKLRDRDENQEERERVIKLIVDNQDNLAEQIGSKHFKFIVKG